MRCVKCNIKDISIIETKEETTMYGVEECMEENIITLRPEKYKRIKYELLCICSCGAIYPINEQLVVDNMNVEIVEDTYEDEEYYTLFKETSKNHFEYATENDFKI